MRHHDLWLGLFCFSRCRMTFLWEFIAFVFPHPAWHDDRVMRWRSIIFDAKNRIWTKLLVKIRPQSYLLGIVQSLTAIFFHIFPYVFSDTCNVSNVSKWCHWDMMGTGHGPFSRCLKLMAPPQKNKTSATRRGNGSLADASWRWRSWKFGDLHTTQRAILGESQAFVHFGYQ